MLYGTRPRILLIDSYDSFTNNLASLCRQAIPDSCVHIIKNDDIPAAELFPLLDRFSAVIVGPGPGSPKNSADVGVVKDLWKVSDDQIIPVFGVCLGLQSLAVECGGKIKRLPVVKHGQISKVSHDGLEIFKGVDHILAVRYHSLHVTLDYATDLEALAWADDGEENGRVIMALKHRAKPFWAVQYHPESVCTQGGGSVVVRNFWRLAKNWAAINRRTVRPWDAAMGKIFGPAWPDLRFTANVPLLAAPQELRVNSRTLELPKLQVTDVCETLGVGKESSDFILLDSAARPGRFSIVGCLDASSSIFTYWVGEKHLYIRSCAETRVEELGSQDIWAWFAAYMRIRRAQGGSEAIPFWGGLVGFLSYELGVESISSFHQASRRAHPDVNLVYVERSIVIDSALGKVHIQSLKPRDDAWLDGIVSLLKTEPSTHASNSSVSYERKEGEITQVSVSPAIVTLPDQDQYIRCIKEAQDYLASGDSYELCLTAATHVSVPKLNTTSNGRSSSWELYKNVRARNPAPHSGYLRLHPSTLVSSSPERFLSFTRPPHSTCQLRPIKGTMRKGPGVTRAVAEEALAGNVKEIAENLMIVDLIRHDLHGVVGSDVEVKQFCKLEEYETVWQLVSVIEGKLASEAELPQGANLGWEVLRRSLPPGSMTGAPKKRSVEILRSLEGDDRSIYSGVFGYWDVGGGGDWSVIIRSCFKFDPQCGSSEAPFFSTSGHHEPVSSSTDEWTLGAGGAITALSDPQGEWDEMITKVESVLRGFGDIRLSSEPVSSTSR